MIPKLIWQTSVRNALNVNQWRTKLSAIYGLSAVAANGFGTRDDACAEAFRLCPFA
jgi:hypothetical protein